MNKLELLGIDQDIYFEKLNNGLEVYILPFKHKNNYFINYFTKFGSTTLEFFSKEENKMIKVPEGIAHFLEHKMFEQEDGIDPFEFFAKSGTGCNASTSYKATRYYCLGTENLNENLEFLINYVNSPYFTDENVEKEKGIICEEINMLKDNPEWFAEEEMQRMLYHKHNFRIPIAGSCESVKSITKKDLYNTYNAFYNPNNMCLFIGGEVDPEEIINIIKKNEILNKIEKRDVPEIKIIKEPLKVKDKYQEVELDNVKTNKLGYALKLDVNTFKEKDSFVLSLYIGMILNIFFGSTSIFKDKMLEEGLLTNLFLERMYVDDFLIIEFWAETDKPNELIEELNKHFNNYQVTKEEVERCKKVWISSEVMVTDNVEATVSALINDIIEYGSIKTNRIEYIRNLNYDKLLQIKEKIDFSNTSTLILKNKEKKDD
jgi:predicted Zn-dependent peptidase